MKSILVLVTLHAEEKSVHRKSTAHIYLGSTSFHISLWHLAAEENAFWLQTLKLRFNALSTLY